MNRTFLFTALFVVTGAASASQGNECVRHVDKINSSITAEAGQAYGDPSTVNGAIRVGSRAVIQGAESVNGSIRVEDQVRSGGLSTVNDNIHVGPRTRIGGDVETVNGGSFIDSGGNVARGVAPVNGPPRSEGLILGLILSLIRGRARQLPHR